MNKAGVVFVCGAMVCASFAAATSSHAQRPDERSSDQLLPLDDSSKRFDVLIGEEKGSRLRMSLVRQNDSGDWMLTFDGLYRMLLHRNGEGEIECERLEILEENKGVRYDPPVRLIPATVKAAQTVTTSGTCEVIDLENDEVTMRGEYEHTLERVSRTQINIPAGTVEGHLIEFSHTIDLDNATLTVELEMGTTEAEGEGLVYWRVKRTIEKLGLFGDTTIRELGCAEFEVE